MDGPYLESLGYTEEQLLLGMLVELPWKKKGGTVMWRALVVDDDERAALTSKHAH